MSQSPEDTFEDSPAFKQMMEDARREQQLFKDRIERIVPIVKQGKGPVDKIVTSDGKEHQVPESAMPVLFPVPFDEDLSIVFGIDEGTHYEWFQKKHMDVIKDNVSVYDLLNKAYENLFRSISQKLSIHMITKNMGMLTDGDRLESSLVLTGEIWTSIAQAVNASDLIFAIPTQDVFVFVRADMPDDVALMQKKVQEIFSNPDYAKKKLSDKLYWRKSSGEITVYNL
ncbi:hypothetical protein [Pseudochryseolinea flava]|uniref:DUF1444 domain-containing protein n=1 Tax=Pseudochryseolinea flava TaxID=2059302 RepID=A0A364XXF6_9BACT|nr:hypothetical protein [Pseudochryseolinea flava]RAV98228.1 hypothetical protein DQQ10_24820 [Pseudochryseolinea flava]